MALNSENLFIDAFLESHKSHLKKFNKILTKNSSVYDQLRKLKALLSNIKVDIKQYKKGFNSNQKEKCISQFNDLVELNSKIKERCKLLEKEIAKIELEEYDPYPYSNDIEEFDYEKTVEGIKEYLNLKSNDELKSPYKEVFSNSTSYDIFLQLHEVYKNKKNNVANYSSIFYAMKFKGHIICGGTAFKNFVTDEYPNLNIDRIDSSHKWKRLTESNHIVNTK